MQLTGKRMLAPALLGIFLGAGTPVALAHDHDHSHDEGAPQQLALRNGHKWATDESLRQAMSDIRAALAASPPAGSVTLQQYQELARKVNGQIAFMVQNCKLDREADAMLHLVLADIIAGADALAGQDRDRAQQGAEKISHALKNYGSYFEHPGW